MNIFSPNNKNDCWFELPTIIKHNEIAFAQLNSPNPIPLPCLVNELIEDQD